jgi:hemolysin III
MQNGWAGAELFWGRTCCIQCTDAERFHARQRARPNCGSENRLLPLSSPRPACRPFTRPYDRAEVLADALAHTVGVGLAFAGIVALIFNAQNFRGAQAVAVWIYCVGLIAMFGTSATYSLWPVCNISTKLVLRRFDQCAIYFFIAATYSPLLMQAEQSVSSTVLFITIWALAFVGVTLTLMAPKPLDRASILLYLAMGWSGAFAYDSVFSRLSFLSLVFLITGGLLYLAGIMFHMWDQLRFQNAIWHSFVVTAAAFQYMAILSFVLPGII